MNMLRHFDFANPTGGLVKLFRSSRSNVLEWFLLIFTKAFRSIFKYHTTGLINYQQSEVRTLHNIHLYEDNIYEPGGLTIYSMQLPPWALLLYKYLKAILYKGKYAYYILCRWTIKPNIPSQKDFQFSQYEYETLKHESQRNQLNVLHPQCRLYDNLIFNAIYLLLLRATLKNFDQGTKNKRCIIRIQIQWLYCWQGER